MTVKQFRRKPIVIEAVQWTGDNLAQLAEFAGDRFRTVSPYVPYGEDEAEPVSGQVFDVLHHTWVNVKTGQWVIRGVQGEYYPIDEQVLADIYEPVEAEWEPGDPVYTPDPPDEALPDSGDLEDYGWVSAYVRRLALRRSRQHPADAPDPAPATEEPPSHFIPAVDSEGRDTQVPVWVFDSGVQLDHAGSVSAWVEGVAADGELSTGAAIDAIERDARRLLAAAAWHRRVAAATLREPADTKDTL